jgi:type I restriction enzyme S subunit
MLKSMYLPPDDVLAEYYAIEDSLTSEIQGNGKESAHLADLRDTLLPRLMSGELSVAEI